MNAGVLAVKKVGREELPEPRGYRWLLDTGEVRFNDDAMDPPCDAYEEWSVCAALYDADQLKEYVQTVLSELIDAGGELAYSEALRRDKPSAILIRWNEAVAALSRANGGTEHV